MLALRGAVGTGGCVDLTPTREEQRTEKPGRNASQHKAHDQGMGMD